MSCSRTLASHADIEFRTDPGSVRKLIEIIDAVTGPVPEVGLLEEVAVSQTEWACSESERFGAQAIEGRTA